MSLQTIDVGEIQRHRIHPRRFLLFEKTKLSVETGKTVLMT